MLWIISAAVSLAGSSFHEVGFLRLGALAMCAIVFLYSVAASATRLRVGSLAGILVAGGALQSGYALLQWGGIDPLFGDVTKGFAGTEITTKIIGTLGYQNTLGGYLALLVPICAYGVAQSRRNCETAIWIFSGTLLYAVIILTRSRAAWCAAGLGIAVFSMICPAILPGKVRLRRSIPLILVAGALLAALSWTTRGDRRMSVVNRLCSAVSASSPAARQRLLIWKATWKMVRTRPIRGHGLGSFSMEYLGNLSEVRQRTENARLRGDAVNVKESHNDYLQMWAEIGIFGVLLWIGFCVAAANALYRAARDARKRDDERLWCLAVLGMLVGFMSLGVTSFPLQILPVAPLFWMLLGTGLGAAIEEGSDPLTHSSTSTRNTCIALGGSLCLGLALCVVLLRSSRLFLMAHACADRRRPDVSAILYRRALSLTPWNGQLRSFYGTSLLSLGDPRSALGELQRSTTTWADVNLWRSLGTACARTGNTAEAIAWLDRARGTGIESDAVKLELGALLLSRHDPRGEVMMRSLVDVPRPNIDAALLLSRYYLGDKRSTEAIGVLRPIADKNACELVGISRRYAFSPIKLAEAMDLLGTAMIAHGDLATAEKSLRTALALNPGSITAKNNLATSLRLQGRTAEALRLWQDVLNVEPDNRTARFNIGASGAH